MGFPRQMIVEALAVDVIERHIAGPDHVIQRAEWTVYRLKKLARLARAQSAGRSQKQSAHCRFEHVPLCVGSNTSNAARAREHRLESPSVGFASELIQSWGRRLEFRLIPVDGDMADVQ